MKHIEQQLREDAQAIKCAVQRRDLSVQRAEIMSRIQSGEMPETGLESSQQGYKWPWALAASVVLSAAIIIFNMNKIESQSKVNSNNGVVQLIQQLVSEKLQENLEKQLVEQMRQEQLAISADVNYLKGLFVLSASR